MLERIRRRARGSTTPAPAPTIALEPREVTLLRLTCVASFEALEAEARARIERGLPPGRIIETVGPDGAPTLRAQTYASLVAAAVDFRIADCEGRDEAGLAAQIRQNSPVAAFWAALRGEADVQDVEPLRRASAGLGSLSSPNPQPASTSRSAAEPTYHENLRALGEQRVAVLRESVRRRIANFDASQAEKAWADAPDLPSVANAQIAAAVDALRAAHPELESEFALVAEMMCEQ